MERLGGVRDRQDGHMWRLDGDHINITGEKFYNHDRGLGHMTLDAGGKLSFGIQMRRNAGTLSQR